MRVLEFLSFIRERVEFARCFSGEFDFDFSRSPLHRSSRDFASNVTLLVSGPPICVPFSFSGSCFLAPVVKQIVGFARNCGASLSPSPPNFALSADLLAMHARHTTTSLLSVLIFFGSGSVSTRDAGCIEVSAMTSNNI